MRVATVLLLAAALFGVTPVTADAAPARDSVSYVALSSGRSGGSSGGGISKSGGHRKSRGSGYSSHRNNGSSSTRTGKMPLWQAILLLLAAGCLVVWLVVKFVRKLSKAVND